MVASTMQGKESRPVLSGPDSEIGVASAGSHVNEPRGLWGENLPRPLRDQAMERVEAGDDGEWEIVMDGRLAALLAPVWLSLDRIGDNWDPDTSDGIMAQARDYCGIGADAALCAHRIAEEGEDRELLWRPLRSRWGAGQPTLGLS